MTHKDIYIKFMIEYDKANVTSSYPSLTEYEVATVLDKAYNALIAQKVSGNNYRRVGFEADLKAISDISPLIKRDVDMHLTKSIVADNVKCAPIPDDFLYYVGSKLVINKIRKDVDEYLAAFPATFIAGMVKPDFVAATTGQYTESITMPSFGFLINYGDSKNLAGAKFRCSNDNISELTIATAYRNGTTYTITNPKKTTLANLGFFAATSYLSSADQWLMIYDENNQITSSDVLYMSYTDTVNGNLPYDNVVKRALPAQLVNHQIAEKFFTTAYNMPWVKIPVCYIEDGIIYFVYDLLNDQIQDDGQLIYVKKPNAFVKDISSIQSDAVSEMSYFDYILADGAEGTEQAQAIKDRYTFECNDTVAEELISLAVAFALENVESQRLNSKLNMRGLEA